MSEQTPCVLNIGTDGDSMTCRPCTSMLLPAGSISAGHPVAPERAFLPFSFLPFLPHRIVASCAISIDSSFLTIRLKHSATNGGTLLLMALNRRLQAAIAPTLLEPDLLAGTNILSHVPSVVLQGLVFIAVGA